MEIDSRPNLLMESGGGGAARRVLGSFDEDRQRMDRVEISGDIVVEERKHGRRKHESV